MLEATSHWRGRRVFVTGCTGFLGGTVVEELLANGAEVVGLVRDRLSAAAFARHQLAGRIHIVYGRAEDLFRVHSALAVYEVQAVFHLAATEPLNFDRGTTTAFEAVRRYDPRIPVVLARPSAAATIIDSPVPLGVARFGELFGQGERKTNRFVPAATLAILNGERISSIERGSRDYVPVRDAAHACMMLSEAVSSRPMPHVHEASFRSGRSLTDREMIDAIRESCSNRPPQVSFNVPASNPLGWSPSLNFSAAIADTVGWCREFVRSPVFPGSNLGADAGPRPEQDALMSITSREQELASELISRYGLSAGTFVVEVGSGNGEFLKPLKEKKIRVLGIEPDVFAMTRSWFSGVDSLSAHFGPILGDYVRHHYGPAKLLVARSVRAGSEEFTRLVAGASRCLSPDGVIAIQSAGVNAFVEVRPDLPTRPLLRAA